MTTASTLHTALEAIGRNLLRSALTSLGIIIGVAAVIVMMAIGGGAQAAIRSQVSSLGTNTVTVTAGSANVGGVRLGQGAVTSLTDLDAHAIADEVPGVRAISPGINLRTQVVSATANWQTQVQGVGAPLSEIRAWPVAAGSFLTDADVVQTAKVAVLGTVVRDQLFGPAADAIGQTVRINNQPFTVIGVLTRKGQSPMGQDQDDTVFVPYTTAQKRLMGVTYLSNILMSTDGRPSSQITAPLTELLRRRHDLQPADADDFAIRSPEEMASVLTATTSTMSYLLAGVAAISLIVGGIGIMNIMLVSVTERTREIGLRRALGARRTDVLAQFLVEATTLSLAGGATGVLLGIAVSQILSVALHWTTVVSTTSIALSFGFAAAVGVLFGYVPARRAARLNPREALHYE